MVLASSRAAMLVAPRHLEQATFEVPEIGENDGLLEVEACGICGTDYEQYCGDLRFDAFRTPYPAIPGHEAVGRIAAIGPAAQARWDVRVGDRVAVRPIYGCGVCDACRRDDPTGCRSRGGTYGLTGIDKRPALWGGYSQYMYLHRLSVVVRLNPNVDPAVGTLVNPLACGLSWAVDVPGTTPADEVVILGSGQRGLSCVVAAHLAGVRSITITGLARDRAKLELAQRLGATNTVVVEESADLAATLSSLHPTGVSVVVDTTPLAADALAVAVSIAAQRGRIVLAGIKGGRLTNGVSPDDITLKQLTISGVSATSAADFIAAAALVNDRHEILGQLHTESFGLDEAEEALLRAAGAGGRPNVVHIAIEPGLTGKRH